MEIRNKRNVIVFMLIITLIFSMMTPLMGSGVYGAEGGIGYGTVDITDYVAPSASGVTYPDQLKKSNLTVGGNVTTTVSGGSISGHWEWANPDFKPTASAVESGLKYPVQFVFDNDSDRPKYKDLTTEVAINVSKGALTVTYRPEVQNLTYGDVLTDGAIIQMPSIVLDNYEEYIYGKWSWVNRDQMVPSRNGSDNGWNTTSYVAIFHPQNENYNTVTEPLKVYVHKAYPVVKTKPTTSGITHGQELSNSEITGGAVFGDASGVYANTPVLGEWRWVNGGEVLKAGKQSAEVIFTPTDTTNYTTIPYAGTYKLDVDVALSPLIIGTNPITNKIVYGQKLEDVIIKGGNVVSRTTNNSVKGQWDWKSVTTMPSAGSISYPAIYTPVDTDNFDPLEADVKVNVDPATPTINGTVTADSIEYGQEITEAAIKGTVDGITGQDNIKGTWTWDNGSEVLEVGTYVRNATFTPDSSNYKPIPAKIEIKVTKSKLTIETAPTAPAIEYLDMLGKSKPSNGVVKHGETVVNGTWQWDDPTTQPAVGTISHTAIFKFAESSDASRYDELTTKIAVKVNGGTLTVDRPPTIGDITYGQPVSKAAFSNDYIVYNKNETSIKGTWKWDKEDTLIRAGEGVTHTAIFTPEHPQYANIITAFAINVAKADPQVEGTPSGIKIKYLSELSSSAISGEVKGVTGSTISGVWKWDDPGDTVPSVGAHKLPVTFYPNDDDNYNTKAAIAELTVYNKELTSGALETEDEGDPTDEVTHDAITAKNKLGDSNISGPGTLYYDDDGKKMPLDGEWRWDNPDQTITSGTISVAAIFVPGDDNFGNITFVIYINVIKIIINSDELITSTGESIQDNVSVEGTIPFGDKVSGHAITAPAVYYDDGDGEKPLPGKWKWKNKEFTPDKVGENTTTAIYVPEDKDYDEVEVVITVIVDKKIVDKEKLYTDETETTTVKSILATDRVPGVDDTLESYNVSGPGVIYYKDGSQLVEIEGNWTWKYEDYVITRGANTVSAIFNHEHDDYGDIEIEFTFDASKQALEIDKMYDAATDGKKIVNSLTSGALNKIIPGKSLTDQSITWPAVYYDNASPRSLVEGEWTWDGNGDFVPTPGQITLNVMFIPENQESWSNKRIPVTIVVNPIEIDKDDISTDDDGKTVDEQINTEDNIVSGDALEDHDPQGPDLYEDDGEGGKRKIKGTWKWKDKTIVPPLGASTQTAVFYPEDTNYKEIEYVNVYIYVFPEDVDKENITTDDDSKGSNVEDYIDCGKENFEAGGKLGDIVINGPTIYYNNQELIGDWKWKDESIIPPVGKSTQTAVFYPSNTNMSPIEYEIALDVDPVEVISLSFGQTVNKVINKNSRVQLAVDLKPENATNKTLTWNSTNKNAASVDSNGLVTAGNTEDKTTITVVSNNNKTAQINLIVAAPVTKIRTPLSTVYMKKKTSYKLPVVTDNGNKKEATKLTYKSSNKKVATVSKSGKIKAKKKGTAKITITAYNGKTKVIKIKVVNAKKSLADAKVKIPGKLTAGKVKQLKVKLSTKKATNVKVTYKSSNKKVATVDKAGRITAIKKGKTKITVKVGNKKITKTLKVSKAKK